MAAPICAATFGSGSAACTVRIRTRRRMGGNLTMPGERRVPRAAGRSLRAAATRDPFTANRLDPVIRYIIYYGFPLRLDRQLNL